MKNLLRAVCFLMLCSMMACVTRDQYSNLAEQRDSLKYELYKEQMLNYKLQGYTDSLYYAKIEPNSKYHPHSPKPPTRQIDPLLQKDSIQYIPPVEDQNPNITYVKSSTKLRIANPDIKVTTIGDSTIYTINENLLFQSGNTRLNNAGKSNLREIAYLLSGRNNILITVEGHTDNTEISRVQGVSDNWDLSVKRATVVVRYLIANGVSPHLLIASGRSKFHPVVSNHDPSLRSLNRRIEIILRPRKNIR